MAGKHGGGDRKSKNAIKNDNVILDPKQGNSRAYTLDRALIGDVLGKQGRPKKGEEKVGNANISKGGSTRAYILARLDRDGHVELAAKVRASLCA
jgi:hypothetical protein